MISWSVFRRLLLLRRESYSAPLKINKLLGPKYNFWKENKWIHISSVCDKREQRAKIDLETLKKKREREAVKIWQTMTVQDLADALKCPTDKIISFLLKLENSHLLGPQSVLNSIETVSKIVGLFNKKCQVVPNPNKIAKSQKPVFVRQPLPKPENLVKRPPVVTVMGHVDHGKTTLLDALRNTFVVDEEFGGITQHIGAFSVLIKSGEKITFIDTPGHAAFTAMRSRGAEVTDFVILVIAADDGIMEQTVESIRIIQSAFVPMIVAVNKIDKPTALKIEDIKKRLLEEGVQVEDHGGDIQLVPISALKKINLDLLVDTILMEAELLDLKGDPSGLVEGVIIESKIDDKMGITATVIIKRGTLKKGKILVAGTSHARVRIMLDENKKEYKEASLSTPVQIFGWRKMPSAGDEVFEVSSEKEAINIIKQREKELVLKKQEEDQKVIEVKSEIFDQQRFEDLKTLNSLTNWKDKNKFLHERKVEMIRTPVEDTGPKINLILKGDVHGTVEVLSDVLSTYTQHDECKMSIVNASVGNVSQSDVELAESFNAIIYAFNVNLHPDAREKVKEKMTDIRFHNILYKLIDDLKNEINSRILPGDDEDIHGEAEVVQNFYATPPTGRKKVPVAGCKCTIGQLKKDSCFKIKRGGEVIYEGKLISMRSVKNEVKTILKPNECGLMFDSFTQEFQPGDVIICYDMIKVPRTTSWNPGF